MHTSPQIGASSLTRRWFFTKPSVATTYFIITVLIGLTYTGVQWQITKNVRDGVFIGLLLGATLVLLQGMRDIYKDFNTNLITFFAFALDKKDYNEISPFCEKYRRAIFNTTLMSITGLCYGLVIASAVFVMHIWTGIPLLRVLLFLLLFSVNFATGVGFFGILRYFSTSWKLSAYVKVDLWQRENPTISFFMNIKKKLALLATVYITMSVTSIFFSLLRAQFLSFSYSVFAGIMIILVFVLPEIPIRKKLISSKRHALTTVNNQLQNEFKQALGETRDENISVDLPKIEKLLLLKEKIEKVSVWPAGMQTMRTVFSVVAITVLPIVLEVILRLLLSK